MDAYEETALIYATFICDNYEGCHSELFPINTDEGFEPTFGKLAKESGWFVERDGEYWITLCPNCRNKTNAS